MGVATAAPILCSDLSGPGTSRKKCLTNVGSALWSKMAKSYHYQAYEVVQLGAFRRQSAR